MAERLDLSALSPAERLVATGGALLFLDGFAPWWYRVRTVQGTYLHNAGLTGWGLAAVMLGFVATLVVVMRKPRVKRNAFDWAWYMALGVAAMIALGAQARTSDVEWFGFWFAALAALLLVAGAMRRRRERRGGWL
jgi:hypothetical protein